MLRQLLTTSADGRHTIFAKRHTTRSDEEPRPWKFTVDHHHDIHDVEVVDTVYTADLDCTLSISHMEQVVQEVADMIDARPNGVPVQWQDVNKKIWEVIL